MPDDPQDQAGTADNENEENDQAGTAADTDTADQAGDGTSDGLKTALQKERAERRKFEKDWKAAQAELKKRDEAEMTAAEKAEARAKDAEEREKTLVSRNRELALKGAVLEAATEFRNPSLALELVRSRVEYDDAGEPTNVSELLAELLAAEPYMKRGAPDIGATNAETQRNGSKLKQEDLERLTPTEMREALRKGELAHLL